MNEIKKDTNNIPNRQTVYSLSAKIEDDDFDVYLAGDTARDIIENSMSIIECAQEAAMQYENTSHLINALTVALDGLQNAYELTDYIRREAYKQNKIDVSA